VLSLRSSRIDFVGPLQFCESGRARVLAALQPLQGGAIKTQQIHGDVLANLLLLLLGDLLLFCWLFAPSHVTSDAVTCDYSLLNRSAVQNAQP